MPTEVNSEVSQTVAALVTAEKQAGNHEFADAFSQRTFGTVQEVHEAYAERDSGTPEVPADDQSEPPPQPLLAGKFKTVEDLEKSYQELQKKLGSGAPKETPKVPTDSPEDAVEAVGLRMSDLESHYVEHGTLSDAHYEAFKKAGLSKEVVDEAVGLVAAARQAEVGKITQEIHETVGGEEAYNELIQWAGSNLTTAEKLAYNTAMDSNNPSLIQLAVQGLHAKMSKATNSQPSGTGKFVSGSTATDRGLAPFESQKEMIDAFNDPRFATLPSYRKQVEQRMAKTHGLV